MYNMCINIYIYTHMHIVISYFTSAFFLFFQGAGPGGGGPTGGGELLTGGDGCGHSGRALEWI